MQIKTWDQPSKICDNVVMIVMMMMMIVMVMIVMMMIVMVMMMMMTPMYVFSDQDVGLVVL